LPIGEVVGRFKKIGSFVIKFSKLGFELENKNDHRPVLTSAKFHGDVEIPWKQANFVA